MKFSISRLGPKGLVLVASIAFVLIGGAGGWDMGHNDWKDSDPGCSVSYHAHR